MAHIGKSKSGIGKSKPVDTYCIICGNKKAGIYVEDDYVLDTLRAVKKAITKKESNKKLVVCKEDYDTYEKYYRKFRYRLALYLSIGVIFAVFSLIVSPSIVTLGIDAFLIIFLYALAMLNYTPKLALDFETAKGSHPEKEAKL